MAKQPNPGFLKEEIQNLNDQCKQANKSFVVIEDDDLPTGNEKEMVHIQFVGTFNKQEVIYDAILCTLQLHYASAIYEAAEHEAIHHFPLYVPIENRDETYVDTFHLYMRS
jgi:seryl-tRNA synthetase